MNSREKKLIYALIVMIFIAVIYNVIRIAGNEGKNSKPVVDLSSVRAFTEGLDLKVEVIKVSDLERYLIKKSEEPWVRDPFLDRVLSGALSDDNFIVEVSQSSEFTYSGFIKIGRKKMAVIDSMEYGVGDELEQGGIIVREIQRSNVVLEVSELHEAGTIGNDDREAKMTIKRIIVPISED